MVPFYPALTNISRIIDIYKCYAIFDFCNACRIAEGGEREGSHVETLMDPRERPPNR